MKEKSRTYNSISNSIWGMASALISVILNFLVRVIIVRELGEEINGLHNLFQNTINVMALMETSISSAMIIHLYAPVKDNDYDLIKKLISFYKKVYLVIAFTFLAVGIVVDILFLEHIVSTTISMKSVHIYFIFFSLSFFANYLGYYKRSILYASQNNRISIISTTISQLVFRIFAIFSAILTHNYLFFLLFLIGEKICSNVICNIYVNKQYPYLKQTNDCELDKEYKYNIFKTIKPLFINQASSTVQNSANSILISMLLGNISIVGYYGNYQLVIGAVQLLFSQIGSAFTSSFGNLATEDNKEKMYLAYRKSCFVMNSLAFICCAGFVSCIQDFIYLVFGTNFVLSYKCVFILVVSMLIYLLNIPIISVQNAMGLHSCDDKIMVLQAIIAILLGYYGGLNYGMEGILLGLTLPTFVFSFIYKGFVVNKIAFEINGFTFFTDIGTDLLKGIITIGIAFLVCYYVSFQNLFLTIVIKGCVSVIVSVLLIFFLNKNNSYFRDTLQMVINVFK